MKLVTGSLVGLNLVLKLLQRLKVIGTKMFIYTTNAARYFHLKVFMIVMFILVLYCILFIPHCCSLTL